MAQVQSGGLDSLRSAVTAALPTLPEFARVSLCPLISLFSRRQS